MGGAGDGPPKPQMWRDNDMKLDRYLINIVIKNVLARCILLFSLSLSICIDYDGVQIDDAPAM